MTELHPGDEALTDLALAEVDSPTRDRLTGHLSRCETCRARYAALADAVEHVLVAAPRVEPPAGFSQRVLVATGLDRTAVGEGRDGPADGRPGPEPRRSVGARVRGARRHRGPSRRTAMLVGGALALGIAVGAGGSAVVLQGRAGAVQQVAVGTPLRTSDGSAVGAVQESRSDGRPVLVVTVAGGPAGVRYACWLVLADGSRQAAGAWALDGSGNGSWVVPWPDGGNVTSVEMVSDGGTRWATAQV